MRIAVLANAGSGGGGKSREALARIGSDWAAHELIGVSGYGGEELPCCLTAEKRTGYIAGLEAALERLLAEKPDFVTFVGGDGTAAYGADWLLKNGIRLPLFGIGTGTANVGPIVSENGRSPLPDPEQLEERLLDAVEVLTEDTGHLCYAFNDLVLGNTFLGTRDGETVTLSAAELAGNGRLVPCAAVKALGGADLSARINGKAMALPFVPAQVIVSPIETEGFYGRAVTGLLCYTPGSPYRAALYMSPQPVISYEESSLGYTDFLPGAQLLLSAADELVFSGLDSRICAVADGNPYLIHNGTVKLKLAAEAASVLYRR